MMANAGTVAADANHHLCSKGERAFARSLPRSIAVTRKKIQQPINKRRIRCYEI